MTGFPGETEAHFRELAGFLQDVSFDHVGVFAYSPEAGTKARSLGGKVPERVALARKEELLDIQMDISQERLTSRLGGEMKILIDSRIPPDERPHRDIGWEGRFYGQAYEIDGVTYVKGIVRRPGFSSARGSSRRRLTISSRRSCTTRTVIRRARSGQRAAKDFS